MPLLKQIENKDCTIALWRIDEDEDVLYDMLIDKNVYKEELSHLKSESRRKEWLAARVLLELLAGDERIVYKPSGKPYLESGRYNISISHTSSYVAIILSSKCNVAIDVEKYGNRVEKVISRFIRNDETITSFQNDMIWSMLLHWSAKETAFKILDIYGIDFKEHFRIFPFVADKAGSFYLEEYASASGGRYQINYELFPDFVMTWAIHKLQ